jgi:hypothetical protein
MGGAAFFRVRMEVRHKLLTRKDLTSRFLQALRLRQLLPSQPLTSPVQLPRPALDFAASNFSHEGCGRDSRRLVLSVRS